MKLTSRESAMVWVTAVCAIGGVTWLFLCRPWIADIVAARKGIGDADQKIQLTERVVAQTKHWQARLAEVSAGLPEFPADRDVTADMLIKLESIARGQGITLPRREAEKEKRHGAIYELAITCKWEGSLDALVHFLFELQQQGAMLDMTQISISPEKNLLKGGFSVNCAYRRLAPAAVKTPEQTPKGK